MDVDPLKQYTILRIKRKRTEEPLDALGVFLPAFAGVTQNFVDLVSLYHTVVESRSRKKKSRGDLNVFQFAQTVEHDAWADEKRRQDLQVRLPPTLTYCARIAHHPLQEQISKLAKESSTPLDPSPATSPIKESKFPLTSRQQKDDASRRYTIVKQDNSESERRRLPTSPYATRTSSLCIDSAPDATSLSQDPRLYLTRTCPQRKQISSCTMRFFPVAMLLLLPHQFSTRKWTSLCLC